MSDQKNRKKGSGGKRDAAPVITDPRFANIQTDPRYRLPSKRHTHTKLDKRFAHILHDKDFSRNAAVDRYGRKLASDDTKKHLERFYRLEDEDEEGEAEEDEANLSVDDDEEILKELKRVESRGPGYDPARDGGFSASSSEDESSGDEDEDEEEEEVASDEELEFPDKQQTDVPVGEVTDRIAVVNLDWDNIRAEDLMAVFSSFTPAGGRVLKVTVYPSEFGKERMEKEETEGPPREIFALKDEEDEDNGEEEELDSDEEEEEIKKSIVKEDKGEEFNSTKLRKYQLERLRYYYAILKFSSKDVAKHVYDNVDGAEYLTSANFFDLRFVPDETDFSDDQPRDDCQRIPDGYQPNDFVTDALQHSKVKLTWDMDDKSRKEAQARAFRGSRKDIDENDLKAYLASDSSENEDDGGLEIVDNTKGDGKKLSQKEEERQRMRALLGLSAQPAPAPKSDGPVGEMEVTFTSGLASGPNHDTIFENEPEETSVEKYLRKERERKKRRKEKLKGEKPENEVDDNNDDVDEKPQEDADLGFDDPFFNDPSGKAAAAANRKEERRKKRAEREAEEAAAASKRAELELLMMDDDDAKTGMRHFDMNEIAKAEKQARKKGKRKGKDRAVPEVSDNFEMDVSDPRFFRLFQNHEFAIDPTNPKFKSTSGMKALLEEGRKRRRDRDELGEEDDRCRDSKKHKQRSKKGASDTDDLKSLVDKKTPIMLGRLLTTAASTLNPHAYSNKPTPQLESVTEEEHTSGLLFPDASVLRRSNTHAFPLQTAFSSPNASAAGAYDDRGGVELDPLKDFRVIIAQDSLGDREPCILLDTRTDTLEPTSPGPGMESQIPDNNGPRHTHARTISSLSRVRRGYLPQSSLAEQSPLSAAAEMRKTTMPENSSAFARARGRSSTINPAGGLHEPTHPRHATETNDAGLLNCIFGSSAFSYRGSSTKMHIVAADDEPGPPDSPATWNSFTRSYTTGSSSGFAGSSRADYKPRSKVTILLTRMFSVNLPEAGDATEGQDFATSMQESFPESGFPFPDVSKRKKIKEKKTPMYAVAITLQIPVLPRNTARPVSRFSTDSPKPEMAYSLDSDYRWRGGYLDEALASAPATLDERIDLLVDHWDVINRTLSHLERLSRKELLFLLKRVDSSGMRPKPAKPPNMQRTNQTFLHLPMNVLALNSKLKDEAVRSARRISTALHIPSVVTGQSRWSVWREEGRSIVRNLGDKDHSFFFLVLITAFLGNHTEWLNALGPDWYRRRHYQQQKAQQDAEPALPYRTVIVSPDKMTARRLIFLLSAFLPPKQRFEPLPSPLRPGTSASTRAVSQSPPTIPVLRQEPLRKAIERRSRAQRLNLTDRDHHHRSVSASSNETAHRSTDDMENDFSIHRRGSDARSIRTIGIPMHPKDARSKNISTATTSTANPGAAVPVPHFASQGRLEREGSDSAIADGVDSLASETLLKSLKRSESSTVSVNSSVPSAGGRWGSLFSGLWSSRQESTDNSSAGPLEPRPRASSFYNIPPKRNPPTLAQMVEEASDEPSQMATSATISIPQPPNSRQKFENTPDVSSTDHTKEMLLKLSVREEDGIVDVELPLPGFVSLSSSGDSTMASPKKTRTSMTSVDALASTHSSGSGLHHQSRDNDGPNISVAGWLKNFHDDFLLQGVRPYSNLEADIKRAMRAEPTPSTAVALDTDGSERWVDVATTLIADVRTFTVKRLRLRRRIVGGGGSVRSPTSPQMSTPGTPRHFSGGSVSTSQISGYSSSAMSSAKTSPKPRWDGFHIGEVEERFVEEPVMDLDGILVDALERVLAQSGPSSLAPTRAPSPSRARKENDRTDYVREDVPTLEVPRTECRRLVLGALEDVVRSVTAEHCREDEGELGVADRERKRLLTGADNTLREGIRKWLLDVEEA
ncbi:hypothetical protein BJX70DRAFT_391353 [Aspergillus crustosus]